MTRALAMAMAFAVTAAVAPAAQCNGQFFFQHRFDEAADAAPNARFDRVKPGFARKQSLCVRCGRAILVHGVVSFRRANAGVLVVEAQPEATAPYFQPHPGHHLSKASSCLL